MLRSLAIVIALAIAGVITAPVLAQDAAQSAASQQTPAQVVQAVSDDLSKAIDGHQRELKNNPKKLIGIVDSVFLPHFDIDYASILVLGRHAREATPEQRARFAKAFYNSLTRRYADGLLDYTKGRVKVLSSSGDLNGKRSIVRSRVVMDDGKTIAVDYAFRKDSSGNWKAYDVIIEGISYITNYRNQVGAEIRKVGIEKLISNLQTQGDQELKDMEQDTKGQQGAKS